MRQMARNERLGNMKKFKLILVGALLTCAFGLGGRAFASEIGFSVNPILPANQAQTGEGYYDLVMKPGQKQILQIQVTNDTAQAMTVDTAIAPASTNGNGYIEYVPNAIKPDPTLKYNLADVAKVPAKTTIAANATVNIDVEVTMPVGATSGIIAGGITLKQEDDTKQKAPTKGMSVINKYQYSVGLFMQQSLTPVAPVLTLNTVAPGQVNLRNVVNANLQNTAMGFLKQMNVDAVIRGVSNTNLLYQYSNAAMEMAPNSNFDLAVPVSTQDGSDSFSQPMQAGKYHLHMIVYGQKDSSGKYTASVNGLAVKYDYKWVFDRDFTITGQQAQKLNATDVTVNHQPGPNWLLIIGLLLLLLALLLLLFILWKRRHEKYEEDVYDEEGNLLHHKGDRVVRGEKVYKLEELSVQAREKVLRMQLEALNNKTTEE